MALGLHEPLDDEERELMESETWDWDSVTELPPASSPGVVLPIRLTLEEMTRVEKAADAEGVSIYEYIKQTVLSRVMHEAMNEPQADVSAIQRFVADR